MATERIVRGRTGEQQPTKSTPENYPIATPPGLQAADRSWVLQTTMELQKSVGALTQAVATLTEQVKDQGAKLDAMRHEVTAARASIKTAGWLLGGIAAVIAWLLYRLPPVVTSVLETIRAGDG